MRPCHHQHRHLLGNPPCRPSSRRRPRHGNSRPPRPCRVPPRPNATRRSDPQPCINSPNRRPRTTRRDPQPRRPNRSVRSRRQSAPRGCEPGASHHGAHRPAALWEPRAWKIGHELDPKPPSHSRSLRRSFRYCGGHDRARERGHVDLRSEQVPLYPDVDHRPCRRGLLRPAEHDRDDASRQGGGSRHPRHRYPDHERRHHRRRPRRHHPNDERRPCLDRQDDICRPAADRPRRHLGRTRARPSTRRPQRARAVIGCRVAGIPP